MKTLTQEDYESRENVFNTETRNQRNMGELGRKRDLKQAIPDKETLNRRELGVTTLLGHAVHRNIVVNVSKGRLPRDMQEKIIGFVNMSKTENFSSNAAFKEPLESGDLAGALEYAIKQRYEPARRLLEKLHDKNLRLNRNEGLDHLFNAQRNPPFQVCIPSKGRGPKLVRCPTAREIEESGALTYVGIGGTGSEQFTLEAGK